MYLSCRVCGKDYPQEKYKELMDDYFEFVLANVPCNRL
ncbi:dual CXXC motif small (seleno)protein [Desulfocicer niacini]